MDYRLLENRKKAFIDWFGWSLIIDDCDPALYMLNYFYDRFEFNIEQRLWITWIYGTTYHFPTAYVIWNEFPDMELVGVDRLEQWNTDNFKRLRYQTDTKWNKGHLPAQFLSYKNWVGDRSQLETFQSLFTDNPFTNFYNLWKEVNTWHKYGRYMSWFYIQTLKQTCGLNIDIDNLWLKDYSGSRSHRNGLCFALGKDDWVDKVLDQDQIDWMENQGSEILEEVKTLFPEQANKADYFGMETCLCSFKKLFRTRNGRYLGYYLDRQAEEIKQVERDGWDGIDWTPLWQCREESIRREYLINEINKTKMEIFLNTGVIDYNNTFSKQLMGLEAF